MTCVGRYMLLSIRWSSLRAGKSPICFQTLLSRGGLGFLLLLSASCASNRDVLHPALTAPVHSIEFASLEADKILMIRQMNPVFMVMGSTGMLLDNLVVEQNNANYEAAAGPVHAACMRVFKQTLVQEISSLGYSVHASGKKYWDYYKPSQQKLRKQTDGILRIRFKQVGFIAKGLQSDYVPSAYVSAELIDPATRKVLYSDRFAIGIDDSIVKIAAMGEGEISSLILPDSNVSYENMKDLLAHPQESRDALVQVAALAARHVAEGLRRKKTPTLMVFEPEIIDRAPFMPSFNVMRERMKR